VTAKTEFGSHMAREAETVPFSDRKLPNESSE
jgi:hypothetical protein